MNLPPGVSAAGFAGADGAEWFLSVEAAEGATAAAQIEAIEGRYDQALAALNLGPSTAVFRRIFVSDVLNQADLVRQSRLARAGDDAPVAVSIVQQSPLPNRKVSLLAYHVAGRAPIVRRRLSDRHLIVEIAGARHLWSTGLCAGVPAAGVAAAGLSAGAQTRHVFDDLQEALARGGARLLDHCVRTWVYVKGVDVFYGEMVEARKALFRDAGLDENAHYIASTGIEGACGHQYDVVAMDAYSNLDLQAEQLSFLNDFDRLCPTRDYGVTFERGTRIAYADRAHYFISGTASIDRHGQVVHCGDVLAQLDRTVDNIEALLQSGGAGLDDLKQLTVYLRDPADHDAVRERLAGRFPNLPTNMVHAPVCRPDWLIEIEAIAVAANADPRLPGFLG